MFAIEEYTLDLNYWSISTPSQQEASALSKKINDIVLASGSPRRLELLDQIGVTCTVIPADIDETAFAHEPADSYVLRLAEEKSAAVYRQVAQIPVLAADTCISLNGKILGKPKDIGESILMLGELSGAEHEVFTGVCVRSQYGVFTTLCKTYVRVRKLSRKQIEVYCGSGEPLGKAGSYAIQGLGAILVEKLNGSYSNVVGLPLFETSQLLEKSGVHILSIGDTNSN